MTSNKKVTFVSAYYTLQSTPYFNSHPDEWNPAPIFELARTGIQLCLYIGPTCAFEREFEDLEIECPNFRLMPYRLYYKDMWIYKSLQEWQSDETQIRLPASRNMEKDTLEYMVYMHSRHEIIEDAISENPWDSTHFAWIDFNSPKLFSNKSDSFQRLQEISKYPFPEDVAYFAGCWPKLNDDSIKQIAETIHWRFCGAFYLADIKSSVQFADLYRDRFPEFLKTYGVFCWEVNFWAWLETSCDWSPTWYRGDHNDNMLNIFTGVSADTYATALVQTLDTVSPTAIAPTFVAPTASGQGGECPLRNPNPPSIALYPSIPPFLPGSASYVEHNGKHYLNTRFVNYWMYPNGYYRFHSPEMVIENRNFCSELDPITLEPLDFREMDETHLYGLDGNALKAPEREKRPFSVGLEDIRLFTSKRGQTGSKMRFIATNVEYSPVSKNRMVLGTYDLETGLYRDCQVIVPPDANSWCEKNWIPVQFVTEDGIEEERFIYKWSPMEIGRVDPATNQLQIVLRHHVNHWLFSRLRGSTTFVDAPLGVLPTELRRPPDSKKEAVDDSRDPEGRNMSFVDRMGDDGSKEYLVGLAHFSEEHSPRHYYHLLILLEKATLKPVRMSRVFYFEKLSIEFCIGMCVRGDERGLKYVFWISRFDRDPICLEVGVDELRLELF